MLSIDAGDAVELPLPQPELPPPLMITNGLDLNAVRSDSPSVTTPEETDRHFNRDFHVGDDELVIGFWTHDRTNLALLGQYSAANSSDSTIITDPHPPDSSR